MAKKYKIAVPAAAAAVLALFFLLIWSIENTGTDAEKETKKNVSGQNGKSQYRVCIETGHGIDASGKWDTGCTWQGDEEAKLMIPITQAMTDYLRDQGVYVYTDAYSGNDRNLDVTLDYLDTHDVDAFVNVHCDYEGSEAGTMPLYCTEEQKELARYLNEGVHEAVEISDRGLQKRTDLETLCNEKVHCVSCLFETGSISSDHEVLTKESRAYGEGLAKGLLNYLRERGNDEQKQHTEDSGE